MGICACRYGWIPVAAPCHIWQLWGQEPDLDYKSGILRMGRYLYGCPDSRCNDRPTCPSQTLLILAGKNFQMDYALMRIDAQYLLKVEKMPCWKKGNSSAFLGNKYLKNSQIIRPDTHRGVHCAICAEQRPLVRLPAATRRSTTATLIKVFR